MPLPKLPTKPAALLSPQDYPKADKDKIVKSLTLIEPSARKPDPAPLARSTEKAAPARARTAANAPVNAPQTNTQKSGSRRQTAKNGPTKLFVLDTNVLMHDPTAL